MLGCMAPARHVVVPQGDWSVDDLLVRYPMDATANIRADEITRTPGASIHLVQMRGGETPHRHGRHDLEVTVLRGEGTMTLDGTSRHLAAGDVAVVPRGMPHWFVRTGPDLAVALVVFVPPLDQPDTQALDDVDSAGRPR
jgi:quercetin dioxygenase-like cupin family protein